MSRKPIIFIPGFPGCILEENGQQIFPPNIVGLLRRALLGDTSRLPAELQGLKGPEDLSVDDGVTATDVIRSVGDIIGIDYGKQAETLYENLEKLGYALGQDLEPVAWDWRRPVDDPQTQQAVADTIERLSNRAGRDDIVVLVHSTGGLVIRSFLENGNAAHLGAKQKIAHLLSMGIPWAGTLKSLEFALGRKAFAGGLISTKQAVEIIGHSWAAFDLMPADPALSPMTDDLGPLSLFIDENGQQNTPLVDQRWIPARADFMVRRANSAHQRLGSRTRAFALPNGIAFPVTNVVGWGGQTLTMCSVSIEDGAPKLRFTGSRDGDETIPRRSAAWLQGPAVTTYHLPTGIYPEKLKAVGHGQLWDTASAHAIIKSVVTDAPDKPYVYAAYDSKEYLNKHRDSRLTIRIMGLDTAGAPLKGAEVSFGSVSRQRPVKVALDALGRGTLRYEMALGVRDGSFYPCEVIIKWKENGRNKKRKIDLGFVT